MVVKDYSVIFAKLKLMRERDLITINGRPVRLTLRRRERFHTNDEKKAEFQMLLQTHDADFLLNGWKDHAKLYNIEDSTHMERRPTKVFTPENDNGEKVTKAGFIIYSFCDYCDSSKFYDSKAEEYYCPLCES